MSNYQHILAAVDLSGESDDVLKKALTQAKANQAKLTVIYVVEPLSFAYGGDLPLDLSGIQAEITEQAELRLNKLVAAYSVKAKPIVCTGRPDREIHRVVDEEKIDLVVIGSHGRHGWKLLLGSTANAVLHGSTVDVLAVRVNRQ